MRGTGRGGARPRTPGLEPTKRGGPEGESTARAAARAAASARQGERAPGAEEAVMPRAPVEPHLFVILGATGDLTRRKLLPAVAGLIRRGGLGGETVILAAALGEEPTEGEYRTWAHGSLGDAELDDGELRHWCDDCLHYQPLGEGGADGYAALARRIEEVEQEHGLPGNRIFYLALPPRAFPRAINALGGTGLNRAPGWARLVIEKPFGRDLESARRLNEVVHRWFDESQVYRIDHYLGKETVRNLLVFRFANPIFESLWNRDRIESVQITVAESLGVGHRAGYYETAGALRDMVQNHLTQLLTLVAMEVPATFDADAIRAEKVKVLRTMEPVWPEDVVYGQYTAGEVDGVPVPGYREEPDVAPDSRTPTFVALRLDVPNWRWEGVPFYLRTGKRLARRQTRIVVRFRRAPVALFQDSETPEVRHNVLTMTLQPNEGFAIAFQVKRPGADVDLAEERLHFEYADAFGTLPEAYETLLYDVAIGDQTLFVHAEEVEASWRLYEKVLDWSGRAVEPYPAGSEGPAEADRLMPAEEGWTEE